MSTNAAGSDYKMMIATQVAYLNAPDDYGNVSVRDLVDWTLAKYDGKSGLSAMEQGQLDTARYLDGLLKDERGQGCGDWVVKDVSNFNQQDGFYACLIDTGDGEAIVGFRGSESAEDPTQLKKDWVSADLGLLNSVLTVQQMRAQQFTKSLYEKYGDQYTAYNFSGHSLGGNLAEHATITAPKGMPIGRCTSYDGPGFSNEYIAAHGNQIGRNGKYVDHYQYSVVGALLAPLPGTNYRSIGTTDTIKEFGDYFTRHATNNIAFDGESVVDGHPDELSIIGDRLSAALDGSVPDALWLSCPTLAFLMTITTSAPAALAAVMDSIRQTLQNIGEALKNIRQNITNWFQNMFGAKLSGEFELNISAMNALSRDLDDAARKIRSISSEVSSIAGKLRYNSLSGSYYKSQLRSLSSSLSRDATKGNTLSGALRDCAQYGTDKDGRAAQICRAV